MRTPQLQGLFLLVAFLVLGCGKKTDADVKPTQEPNSLPGGQSVPQGKKGNDTTSATDPLPKPKPPVLEGDEATVAELTKKGFIAEIQELGKYPGIEVLVPSTLPMDALKGLNGLSRVRTIMFKKNLATDPEHPVTAEAIQSLTKLDGLRGLGFEGCPKLTAGAFRDLSRFPMLTQLKVASSPLDDAATEELAKVKTLGLLNLDGSRFTDKALANLATINTLKVLWVHDAKEVTAAGIKSLNALTNLEFLSLQGTPPADDALSDLNLPNLEFLKLERSDISDDGVGKMPVLPKLRNLTLGGMKFTDAGLKHFLKQPSLESVTLFGTKATKAATETLKKDKPKLVVGVIE